MKEKIVVLLILVFIAMSISGFTYAQRNDTIVVSNMMTFGQWGGLNMGFVEPLTCTEFHTDPATGELVGGEYLGKDVGKCECHYTDLKPPDINTGKQGYATLVITITNAYPDYEVHCNFTLENIGTLPLYINETVISDPNGVLTWDSFLGALVDADGKPIINITMAPELVGNQRMPDKAEFEMAIHITENAEECHIYTFQVKIMYEEA